MQMQWNGSQTGSYHTFVNQMAPISLKKKKKKVLSKSRITYARRWEFDTWACHSGVVSKYNTCNYIRPLQTKTKLLV